MTDDAGVLALRDEPDERRACVGGMLCGWEEAEVLLRADRFTLGEKLGGMPLSLPPAALGVRDDDEGVMVRGVCDDARERRPAEGIKLGGLICGSAPPDSCVITPPETVDCLNDTLTQHPPGVPALWCSCAGTAQYHVQRRQGIAFTP